MKAAVCVLGLALLCSSASPGASAGLTISGPQAPVLEGDDVTLECLSDSDYDMTNYTFQKYSRWMRSWVSLDSSQYLRCWYFSVNITRSDERLLMHLKDISEWRNGPYRCVRTDNRTGEVEASEPINISVIFLQGISMRRLHSWSGSVSDVLWAERGSTVEVQCSASASRPPLYEWSQELSDWILPSDTLVLRNVNEESEGRYMCQARHPDMRSLVRSRSFQLRVVDQNPLEVRGVVSGLSFGDILLFIAVPTVLLSVLVFTLLSLLLRHRNRQRKKPQISLVDGEQRAPIYKGSLQSVYSTSSDSQPLVM
ncbi:tyrosine-protein kinase-like otk [Engystomops pustulosus]|uniref:tyrosine-protein kinase-like otk n=1 Tax=Engystomops pustulosus TaxID=76066 RepID=UPI003AFB38F5